MKDTRRGTRRRQLEPQQRAALLDAAADEFLVHGFDGASVQSIARAVGITKSKLFYYYDSKEDLYAEVLDVVLDELLAATSQAPAAASADAFWQRFRQTLGEVAAVSETNPRGMALAATLYRRGGEAPSYLRLLGRLHSWVRNWLAHGRRLGAVRADVPIALLDNLVTGALAQVDRALIEAREPEAVGVAMVSTLVEQREFGKVSMDAMQDGLCAVAESALRPVVSCQTLAELRFADDETPTVVNGDMQVAEGVAQEVVLENARALDPAPALYTHGFQKITAPIKVAVGISDLDARGCYGQVSSALEGLLGVHKALVFDHTIRRSVPGAGERPTTHLAHIDYGQEAGERRLRELLPSEAEAWSSAGFALVNLWLSLDGVIHSQPLALAQIDSIEPADIVPVTVDYGQRQGHIGYLRHRTTQRWYWFPYLHPTEALLFLTYSSRAPAAGLWSCPHTAFEAPNAPPEAQGYRASIEFRAALRFKKGAEL